MGSTIVGNVTFEITDVQFNRSSLRSRNLWLKRLNDFKGRESRFPSFFFIYAIRLSQGMRLPRLVRWVASDGPGICDINSASLFLPYYRFFFSCLGTITTDQETRASESKADKVGTLVFTLRLGSMPGLPSSMMPKVPKYGIGTALVWYPRTLSLRRPSRVATVKLVVSFHPPICGSIWKTGAGDWSLSQSRVPAQVMKEKCFPQESPLAGYSYLPPSTGQIDSP